MNATAILLRGVGRVVSMEGSENPARPPRQLENRAKMVAAALAQPARPHFLRQAMAMTLRVVFLSEMQTRDLSQTRDPNT
jgi:hypothetical protein